MAAFGSSYGTPGWQRAQANKVRGQKRSFGYDDGAERCDADEDEGRCKLAAQCYSGQGRRLQALSSKARFG